MFIKKLSWKESIMIYLLFYSYFLKKKKVDSSEDF